MPDAGDLRESFAKACHLKHLVQIDGVPPHRAARIVGLHAGSASHILQGKRQRHSYPVPPDQVPRHLEDRTDNEMALARQPLAVGADPAGLPAICWRRAEFTLLPEVPILPVSQVRKLISWGELRSIPSCKMRRDTITTSKAERQLAYEAEWDDDVSFFLEQPFGIQYRLGGRRATYTPDLYRLKAGCHEVVEAKNLVGAAEPDWTIREPVIREAFAELGFQLVVWVLEEMAPEPRARNIWRQIRDRQSAVPDCADLVRGHLDAAGPTPLWRVVGDLGVRVEALRQLVAHGLIDADVDQPFDNDIVLSTDAGSFLVGGRS